jgi:hypothetical protein
MTRRWKAQVIVLCVTLVISFAQGIQAQENPRGWIVENAPEVYIVHKGDTLWDIACKFLHDPWRWKQIWHANNIENPNLIYPGDRIMLTYVNGRPRLGVARGESREIVNPHTGVVMLYPKVRSFPADRAIPTIPLHVIGPFFNESRVVTPEQATHCPPVTALDEDHLVVGIRDLFYVSNLSPAITETIFSVFRPGKVYIDPTSSEPLGIEGLILGKAQLERPGNPARLQVIQSFAEIKIGDRLIGTSQEKINAFFTPKYPNGEAHGQIISVFGGINQIGQYQIVVITGGKDQQREVGDVLGISQIQKDLPTRFNEELLVNPKDFPPLHIGTAVVFRVFDRVSYALIMKATRAIYLLDEVTTP